MTLSAGITDEGQVNRDFIDALRQVIGLAPLYRQVETSYVTMTDNGNRRKPSQAGSDHRVHSSVRKTLSGRRAGLY